MVITRTELWKQLQNAISDDEWTEIMLNEKLSVSEFNRGVLLEMKEADLVRGSDTVQQEQVEGLYKAIRDYLAEYLSDKPDCWKWILISCIYLTFIAERPMHPIDQMDIKEVTVDGEHIYECPCKSNDINSTCYYCVCKRMSNYEIMKRRMQKEFLKYDQEKMIRKFQLQHDPDYIYIHFIGRRYRIYRTSGKVMWSDDGFIHSQEAGYNEAMTIYDVLCYSKEDCRLSGEFVNMKNLSSIQAGSAALGGGLFRKMEKSLDHKSELLSCACEKLNGTRYGKGDVAYQIPLFDFLPVVFQFWDSDDEFPASLNLLTDKNMLEYMHFETVWFAVGHFMARLQEEMSKKK